jgi:hypothetical protein
MTLDWTIRGPSAIKNDNSSQICAYQGVLSDRPAKKETDPPVPTLKFEKPDSLGAAEHDSCQIIMSNLTNLDQPSIREQIAKIINQFPCPNANVTIKAFQIKNNAIKTVYPTARSNRTMNLVRVDGCLKERIQECVIPMSEDPVFIMTYEDLKNGLARCRDAMKAAVQKGAELAAWKDQNDPNKNKSPSLENHPTSVGASPLFNDPQ